MSRNKTFQNVLIILGYCLLAIICDFAFFKYRVIWGANDTQFHLGRINEWLHLNQGQFPYLSTHSLGGVGAQINVFYPSQLLYPLVVLIKVFQHPVASLYVYVALLSILTALLTDYATYSIFKNRRLSVLTAVFYTFSFYRMLNFYHQFDLGQLIAMTFVPLTFSGFYKVLADDSGKWQLVVGMAGMIFSHVMLTFLLTLLLGIIFLVVFVLAADRWRILRDCLVAAVMTALLTAAFWLPMIVHMFQVPTGLQPTYWKVSTVISNSLSGTWKNILLNQMSTYHTPGTFLIVVGLTAAVYILWNYRQTPKVISISAILFLILFWMTTAAFPWHWFDHTFVTVIQFASRLCAFITLFASLIIAYGITVLLDGFHDRKFFTYFAIFVSCGMTLASVQSTIDSYLVNQPVITNKTFADFSAVKKYNALFDYFPQAAQPYLNDLSSNQAIINGKKHYLKGYGSANAINYTVQTNSRKNTIDLPCLNYGSHAYRITNNQKAITASFSRRGTFLVRTKTKKNHLRIAYVPTTTDRLAVWISAISWLVFILVIIYFRLHKNIKLNTQLGNL